MAFGVSPTALETAMADFERGSKCLTECSINLPEMTRDSIELSIDSVFCTRVMLTSAGFATFLPGRREASRSSRNGAASP